MPKGSNGKNPFFPKVSWDFWIDLLKLHGQRQKIYSPVGKPRPQPHHQSFLYCFEEHVLQICKPRSLEHRLFKITNSKSQPSPKRLRAGRPNKLQIPSQNDRPSPFPSPPRGEGWGEGFEILNFVHGIYLGFGASNLVLPYSCGLCSMRYAYLV